jgi:hypothetical protein
MLIIAQMINIYFDVQTQLLTLDYALTEVEMAIYVLCPVARSARTTAALRLKYSDRTAEIASPKGKMFDLTAGYLFHTGASASAPFVKAGVGRRLQFQFQLMRSPISLYGSPISTYGVNHSCGLAHEVKMSSLSCQSVTPVLAR